MKQYNLRMDEEVWIDLERLARLMGTTRSMIIRETLEQTVSTLKRAFGGNLEPDKVDMANYYRTMLLETSKALGQVAEPLESARKK